MWSWVIETMPLEISRNSGPYGAGVVCHSGCTFCTTFGSTGSSAGPLAYGSSP